MILADKFYEPLMKSGCFNITPFKKVNLGPNSYDLTVANCYREYDYKWMMKNITLKGEGFIPTLEVNNISEIIIEPRRSVIVVSNEVIEIGSGFIGFLSARSNLALVLDFNLSNLIDTGFRGRIGCRIHNHLPTNVRMPVNYRFLQLMIMDADDVAVQYMERELSKNLTYDLKKPHKFKVDKEFK